MRSPSGGEARRRGGTHIGKAPLLPEMMHSDLTESGLSGRIMSPNIDLSPALPDVRPAPQAGCFVSRLYASCESQRPCDSFAFRTRATVSSSISFLLKRSPGLPHGPTCPTVLL